MASSDSSPIFSRRSEIKKCESGFQENQDSSSSDSDNRSKRGKKCSKQKVLIASKLQSDSRGPGDSPSRVTSKTPQAFLNERAPEAHKDSIANASQSIGEYFHPSNSNSGQNGVACAEHRNKSKFKKSRKKSISSVSSSSCSESSSSSNAQSCRRTKKRKHKNKKTKRSRRDRSSSSASSSSFSSRSSAISYTSSDEESTTRKKFTPSKARTKQLLGFLTKTCKADELKSLQKDYCPKFDCKYFDLKRPKLDRQVKRRLKRVRSYDAARASAKEKNLANIQFKLLDVFRPLLYAWALICSGDASEEHPLMAAVVCSMKLLGHCFNYLSCQRRSNILKVTDPEYEDVANDPALFDKKEFCDLFGKSFCAIWQKR